MNREMSRVQLAPCELPDFGVIDAHVVLPRSTYVSRLDRLRGAMAEHELDTLIIYGDREHSANICWLTGFDPRFEEALAIVRPQGDITLVVGAEGLDYAKISELDAQVVFWAPFGLLGQPQHEGDLPLSNILTDAGVKSGQRVGVTGWKYRSEASGEIDRSWFEVPYFLVSELRQIVGEQGVRNASDLLMHQTRGLRATCEVEQLAVFESNATRTSQAFRDVMLTLRDGMTERDLMRNFRFDGTPLNCHAMMSSGERTAFGLASPSVRRIEVGDPVSMAVGVQGSLTCRAGAWGHSERDLPIATRDYFEKVVAPYFNCVAKWYQALRVGASGATFWDIAVRGLPRPFFDRQLNPGHLIHLDEWMNTPIREDSAEQLVSGMYLQVDIIPRPASPYPTTNIEDGVALADEVLRGQFASQYPAAWARIESRRAFMQEVLGLELGADVLPFSNMPAWLVPFWLEPGIAVSLGA